MTPREWKFEHAKESRIGSYAKNVIYHSSYDHVCPVCGGPKRVNFEICQSCWRELIDAENSGGRIQLADTVRISHYAFKYDQMYRVMRGYKNDDSSASGYQETLKYILGDALFIHYRCIEKLTGSKPTAWTVVPSTKSSKSRFAKPSVLEKIVKPMFRLFDIQHIQVRAVGEKHRRQVVPETFEIVAPQRDRHFDHVLVIDDSWTSGGTAQSMAAMLKQQGARQVTIYCAARIVDLNYASSEIASSVAKGFQNLPYRRICPWLLDDCERYKDNL